MSYQDYVIKDGLFIGKFEEMYQKYDDPWNQKASVENSYMNPCTVTSIKKYQCRNILEVGCGLGGDTAYLKSMLPELHIEGMDLAETAVFKAKQQYPNIHFFVDDILSISKVRSKLTYDMLLFAQIMWYILADLDNIIYNLSNNFQGKLIMINQTFYKKGVQKYGTNYFTSVDEMCSYLPWKCLEQIVEMRPTQDSIQSHSVFRVENK